MIDLRVWLSALNIIESVRYGCNLDCVVCAAEVELRAVQSLPVSSRQNYNLELDAMRSGRKEGLQSLSETSEEEKWCEWTNERSKSEKVRSIRVMREREKKQREMK